jgi:hypothetical protein
MKPFDITNWYWIVAGDQTRVFASKSGDYVPVADATFVAWKADGTLPTAIDTEASLGAVLASAQLRPAAAGILDSYTSAQASTVIAHAAFKILFNQENRLRAIERQLSLNGSPANLTAAQALAAIKALM